MNLDLLKKLVKLANNNPNENEANLAARKVCKLIEDANFNFGSDIRRTTEPEFKSTRTNAGFDWIIEYMRKAEEERIRRNKEAYESRSYDAESDFYVEWDINPPNSRPKKSKRNLKCKTCKEVKETIFAGAEELFECNPCQWTAYARKL